MEGDAEEADDGRWQLRSSCREDKESGQRQMVVGVRLIAARFARAEKIPIGGSLDACMDGVSLCLEKNKIGFVSTERRYEASVALLSR